ncbi:hypothetical protein Vafri_8698 [Volvox africanus]|uniref:Vps72/YL1 C-terminal domain-containing protein n=2 Tax=Volvox africanus TaxID=51714 RepID=A0A8J4B7D2_9CHLO|nr:hypothetical protein Vafri_8698 [Volvox africanus]
MGRDKSLPERSTRGKRLKQAVDDEEDQADNAFWNQEFFKEEAVDDDYKTESEPEDEVDTDFDDNEEDDDDEEILVKDDEPRKKALKPPGYKPKPKPKPKPKLKPKPEEDDEYVEDEGDEEEEDDEEGQGAAPKPAKPRPEPVIYVAPTLRRSTVAKVAEAQRERQYKEKSTRRRGHGSGNSNWRPLTQQELLAEAALNEIENTRSLKALLAQEEETKRKAQVVKKKNTGPSVKFKSRKGSDALERSTLELINTLVPPTWMQPTYAPLPSDKPTCAITGLPARYQDPLTHAPFANTLAFKRLRTGTGPLPLNLQQELVRHHFEEVLCQQQPGQLRAPLVVQLRAQKQRREDLEEKARAFAAVAAASLQAPELLPQGPTVDVMALVVDAHRYIMAGAS